MGERTIHLPVHTLVAEVRRKFDSYISIIDVIIIIIIIIIIKD